jgi:succinate-semialdehyde dehydrogenase/glutarate-semialdehyde dehydrogenase
MSIESETTLLASVPDGLFIGGVWGASSSGRTIDVQDPATGAVLKSIADATPPRRRRARSRRGGRRGRGVGFDRPE